MNWPRTTNREGNREYKRDANICTNCPYLCQCTNSENHVKVVNRHVWQCALDEADENRYTYGLKDLYKYRKETIERIFGLAKSSMVSDIRNKLERRRWN